MSSLADVEFLLEQARLTIQESWRVLAQSRQERTHARTLSAETRAVVQQSVRLLDGLKRQSRPDPRPGPLLRVISITPLMSPRLAHASAGVSHSPLPR